MASSKASWFRRNILHRTPLYRLQPCGNFHHYRDRFCFCNVGEHWSLADGLNGIAPTWGSWHGGIRDLKTGTEYIPFEKSAQHDCNGVCVCEECSRRRRRNSHMFKPELSMVAMPADRCAEQLAKERSDAVIERAFADIESHDIAVSHFIVGDGQAVPPGDYRVTFDGKVEKNLADEKENHE